MGEGAFTLRLVGIDCERVWWLLGCGGFASLAVLYSAEGE